MISDSPVSAVEEEKLIHGSNFRRKWQISKKQFFLFLAGRVFESTLGKYTFCLIFIICVLFHIRF